MNAMMEEIKRRLASRDPFSGADKATIHVGELTACSGGQVGCRVLHGLNPVLANRCDDTWGVFNMNLMRHIQAQGYSAEELAKILGEIQIDDGHWRWLDKTLFHNSAQYEWFFLEAEREAQAACLIYHPKPSAADGQGIFYIEYIATAPWNRRNPMSAQAFKGAATLLVRTASSFAIRELGLRPGFSLHSLPKAVGYYLSIGMKPFPHLDKEPLKYFEMLKDSPLMTELASA